MFKVLYELLVLLISGILGPVFALHRRGKLRLSERFGSWDLAATTLAGQQFFWFHGASLGEVNGLIPLMKVIRERFPEQKILLTATSTTGLDRGSKFSDVQRLLPFDAQLYLRRGLHSENPRAFFFGETEIWPGLIALLFGRRIPLFLVNARVSESSFRWYSLLRPLLSDSLSSLSRVCVSDQISKERFLKLGVSADKLFLSGNAKYDHLPSVVSKADALQLKASYFSSSQLPVLVLGSLRPGEEGLWFAAIQKCRAAGQNFHLIVAPRHAEKFDFFGERLKQFGIRFIWASKISAPVTPQNQAQSPETVLLDSMGVLEKVYSFADLVFIGGSLKDFGGHNPLEAAAYGVPICMGPYYSVVQEVVDQMKSADAIIEISTAHQVEELLKRLSSGDSQLLEIGNRGYEIWKEHCGAAGRIIDFCLKN